MKQVKNPTSPKVWTGALTLYISLVRKKYKSENTSDAYNLQRLIEEEFGKFYKITVLEDYLNAEYNFEDWESQSRRIEQ